MRSIVLVACLCAGCVRDAMPGLPEAQESVVSVAWANPAPYRIDVLFVIDDSPAMQPYQAQLAEGLRLTAGDVYSNGNALDLHIGVITADLGDERDASRTPLPGQCAGWGDAAAFHRSVLVDGAYIHYRNVRGETINASGRIEDVLPALGDVGAAGCVRARPLDAMRIALDHDPHDGGFRRADARLAVIILSADDDDSASPVADYVDFLKRQQPNVAVMVAGGRPLADDCGEQATDRLYAFSQQFPQRGGFSSICYLPSGGFLGQALAYLTPGFGPIIGMPCFEVPLADVDPTAPGVQPDCSVSERIGVQERLMAACGTGELPCWRIVEDSQCGAGQHLRLDIDRGGEDPPDNDIVEAQCVAS